MALRISPWRRLHLSPADPHTGLEARIARRSPAFFALKQHLACGPLSPWPLQPACANWRFYSASPPEYPSPSSARLLATKRHSRRFCLTRVLPGMAAELAKPPTRQLPLPLPAGAKLPTFLRMPARRRQPHRPALQRGVAIRACGTACAKIHSKASPAVHRGRDPLQSTPVIAGDVIAGVFRRTETRLSTVTAVAPKRGHTTICWPHPDFPRTSRWEFAFTLGRQAPTGSALLF